jgi:hypothetical protein
MFYHVTKAMGDEMRQRERQDLLQALGLIRLPKDPYLRCLIDEELRQREKFWYFKIWNRDVYEIPAKTKII